MSAPAGWRKGSFRGVSFVTQDHEQSGGRRLVQHEFPQSNDPVLENLGRRAKSYMLELYVRGADHIAQADRLGEALDADGVGTLIHPWLGSMQVAASDYTRRDSVSEGGLTRFSVTFMESGLPAVPAPASDTPSIAQDTAAAQSGAAPAAFAGGFSVAGVTGFVEDAAEQLVQGAALVAQVQAGLSGGAGGALRAFQAAFDRLGVPGIVRDAIGLGQSVTGLVQVLGALGGGVATLEPLADWGSDLDPVVGSTPARAQQRANQAAIVQLVNIAASAELVRTISTMRFSSYEDAVAIRDRTAARLDALASRQADAGDDIGGAGYDALRRAMVRDVTARGGSLARLQRHVPALTEPALVTAHRLYGPIAIETRAGDIVARNRIVHPGFVPGGRALAVLTPAGLAAEAIGG
jgi:prophage DNA circulation protein